MLRRKLHLDENERRAPACPQYNHACNILENSMIEGLPGVVKKLVNTSPLSKIPDTNGFVIAPRDN